MPTPNLLTPKTARIATELFEWCSTYLAGENEGMKRPSGEKVVCPFVQPSLDADALYMAFHPEISRPNETHVEELMAGYAQMFTRLGPFAESERIKKAMLIVFPNIPEQETPVLDAVHKNIKASFVKQGLMVGQFHKRCKEVSAHNKAFRVSIAPYPLMAIRHMAIHDILFVAEDREWFNEYNLRFSDRFRRSDEDDNSRSLRAPYQAAKARWSV